MIVIVTFCYQRSRRLVTGENRLRRQTIRSECTLRSFHKVYVIIFSVRMKDDF